MSTDKVILGTVVGLAVGGILGILFAPEKGSVIRQQIMDKGTDYADELKSKYNELADSISDKFQKAKGFAQDLNENMKAEFNDMQNDSSQTSSNYKS